MSAAKKKTKKKAAKKKAAPKKKKAAKKAAPKKKAAPVEEAAAPKGRKPKYFGYEKKEWLDLKDILIMAAFKGKISRKVDQYADRQVVVLAKKYVLSRSKSSLEKAVNLLCPDEAHPWTALFKTRA